MSAPEKLLRPNADSEASAAVHRIANPEVGERSIQSQRHHPAFDEPDPLVTPKHSAAGGEAYFIIIGVAMVLIALFGHVALQRDSQLARTAAILAAEKAHSLELQQKVESLEQQVTTLKETADYYFQRGVDQQAAGDLYDAKAAFETVIAKFPNSHLVGAAQERLAAVNAAFAKAEAESLTKQRR